MLASIIVSFFTSISCDVRNNSVKYNSLMWDTTSLGWCCVLRSTSTSLHRINFAETLYTVLIGFCVSNCRAVWCVRDWQSDCLENGINKYVTLNDRDRDSRGFIQLVADSNEKAVNWYFNDHCSFANAHTHTLKANTSNIQNNKQLILPTASNAFDPDEQCCI